MLGSTYIVYTYVYKYNYARIYIELERNMTEPPEFILPSSIKGEY